MAVLLITAGALTSCDQNKNEENEPYWFVAITTAKLEMDDNVQLNTTMGIETKQFTIKY
jgi:hypothetical protein